MNAVQYKKILVPIDGSPNSYKAVQHAGYLAACTGATVGLLHVMISFKDLQVYAPLGTTYIPEDFMENAEEFGNHVLAEAIGLLPPEVHSTTFLELGSPAERIPGFAQSQGYDVIVMGRRGLGVLKELVMGSVSHYVLHHAKCPVMVIK